jgi:hypothetical protein
MPPSLDDVTTAETRVIVHARRFLLDQTVTDENLR